MRQRHLDDFREAQQQVGFADRILLSKTDLVSASAEERLRERLAGMNPRAPVGRVHFGEAPIEEILDIHGFGPNATLELDADHFERGLESCLVTGPSSHAGEHPSISRAAPPAPRAT